MVWVRIRVRIKVRFRVRVSFRSNSKFWIQGYGMV